MGIKKLIIFLLLFCTATFIFAETIVSHAISMRGTPKYGPDFSHFDYVNPNAPKGGTVRLYGIGTFDNFNRYALRGDTPAGILGLYDDLIVASEDEVEMYYGLIAEKMEYPDDNSWIIFHINPRARFQDGKPITAEDVVFSFYKFFNEGVPQFKEYYSNVAEATVLDARRAKFTLKEPDKEMLLALGGLTILPKHYWESRDFSEPITEVPLGSGPYTISDFKMGQYVIYERKKDYWALNHPTVKGQLNFDYVRYDYYRDQTVAFEAFKAGEYDFRQENISKNWATLYTGGNFDKGYIQKEELEHQLPQGMQAFVFNTQRPFFRDRKVRMAINYAMDFEWMNKNLFYGQYKRLRSFFQNTKYEATGLPSREERIILEPLRSQIPPEVFTKEYNPPVTDGSGNIRQHLRTVLGLFKEAGWELRDRKMVNNRTGEPLEFEMLLYSPFFERIAIPIQQNLEKFGVTMNIRMVDSTQFLNRLREREFDMIASTYSTSFHPNSNLQIFWHSDFIDSTYNTAGVTDEAVDTLVKDLVSNLDNEDALLHYGRALDRVLTWNHYVIPQWYINSYRIAYWDKFSRPATRPKYGLGFDSWWIDPTKASRLPN